MGITRTKIFLANPRLDHLAPLEVEALADTGALHLCIPEHIAIQLNLTELEKREVTLADGRRQLCSYTGPITVKFQNRQCFVGALIIGDEVLLGAIPMEDLDILVHPATQQVGVLTVAK